MSRSEHNYILKLARLQAEGKIPRDGVSLVDLFSFRATDPKDLRALVKVDYARAVGINDGALIEHANRARMVIAAWGTHGNLAGRAEDVMARVLSETPLFCIGKTKDGFPLHPCMTGYTDQPLRYR